MSRLRTNQTGFAHLALILAVVAVLGIGGAVFWRVRDSRQDKSTGVSRTETTEQANEDENTIVESLTLPAEEVKTYPKVAVPEDCADYEHDTSAEAATSYAAIEDGIVGEWIGCVTTPWIRPYKISIEFKEDGTYSTKYLDSPSITSLETEWPALYYGTNGSSDSKTYSIDDYQDNGEATGTIVIDFGGTTNTGSLKNIVLTGNTLSMNFWHRNSYGPLLIQVVRANQD